MGEENYNCIIIPKIEKVKNKTNTNKDQTIQLTSSSKTLLLLLNKRRELKNLLERFFFPTSYIGTSFVCDNTDCVKEVE